MVGRLSKEVTMSTQFISIRIDCTVTNNLHLEINISDVFDTLFIGLVKGEG